jgi:hypothetical protein
MKHSVFAAKFAFSTALLAISLASAPAHADGGAAASLSVIGARAELDGAKLHVSAGQDLPDPLRDKHLRLDGNGALFGGELRIEGRGNESSDWRGRTHGGFSIAVFGIEHALLSYDALVPSLSIDPGKLWGARFDLFIGREFSLGKRRGVYQDTALIYPYVDLRASFSVLQANVSLRHETLGLLGTTAFNAYAFGIGPRIGARVPLMRDAYIDFGAYGDVLGIERIGGYAGLGIWAR